MPTLWVVCQTSRQARILSLLEASGLPSYELLTDHDEPLGSLKAVPCRIASWASELEPSRRFAAFRAEFLERFRPGDVLLTFQDQHLHVQAAVEAARTRNVSTHLAQDGFLDFEVSHGAVRQAAWQAARPLYGRMGWNRAKHHAQMRLLGGHFFGHSQPDYAYVWGPATRERLRARFGLPFQRCIITGALGLPSFDAHPSRHRTGGKILFLDQPFKLFGRISKDAYESEYLKLLKRLSYLNLTVKLHPGTAGREAAAVHGAVGASRVHRNIDLLMPDDLEDVSAIATVSSTAFISVIQAGVPCVLVDLPSSRDRVPLINHPLIRRCTTADEAADVLEDLTETGRFSANERGRPLEDFVSRVRNGPAIIADRLAMALGNG